MLGTIIRPMSDKAHLSIPPDFSTEVREDSELQHHDVVKLVNPSSGTNLSSVRDPTCTRSLGTTEKHQCESSVKAKVLRHSV